MRSPSEERRRGRFICNCPTAAIHGFDVHTSAIECVLAEIADQHSPLRTDIFADEFCRKCGVPEGSALGFTAYGDIYRAEGQKRMLVLDDGAIPPAAKFHMHCHVHWLTLDFVQQGTKTVCRC